MKKTVLITGAKGLIGSILREALAEKYHVLSLSRQPIPGVETITADISDLDAMIAACKGVDSVVHMAASASFHSTWEQVLPANIIGVYNVYEAAARNGVKQVIFASSNHAVGTFDLENAPGIYREGMPMLDHLSEVRPDGYYGVSKCFGEALGRYYADHRDLNVICLRIGWINHWDRPVKGLPREANKPRMESPERLSAIWLSHRDMIQLVEKSIEAEHVKYDILYGISNNQPHFYDLERARERIGYVPQDGAIVAEVYSDQEPEKKLAGDD